MQSDKENILLVDSVHLEFGQNQVLQSAYLTARTGRVTGVLGRNGTGKSCLFKCIMGGIKPQNIFIRFNDEMSTDYGHIGKRVKYLPQNLFMPSNMTLDEAFTLYGVDYDGLVTFDTKYHMYQRRTFKELSGGEARIVEMYLVLMSDAEFCILDEPFSNIAPNCVEKMQVLIQEQKKNTFPIKSREDLIHHGYILR